MLQEFGKLSGAARVQHDCISMRVWALAHQFPTDSPRIHRAGPLASIIHLSDYLINEMLEGSFSWERDLKLDEEIIKILKFNDREAVDNFINEYRITLIEQAASVGIKV